MITIPIWVFVILCVLAGLMAILILLIICFILSAIFTPSMECEQDYEESMCPYEIDEDNPDYNPEHIPHVERED